LPVLLCLWHHPVHIAKSAATIDQLSGGRLLLGIASGDRTEEYPARGIDFDSHGERFRESFHYIRKAQEKFPVLETKHFGNLSGYLDLLPEPIVQKIPLLITGSSRQSLEWIAQNADGWMNYPRDLYNQMLMIKQWRDLVARNNNFEKSFLQSLYVILEENDNFKP